MTHTLLIRRTLPHVAISKTGNFITTVLAHLLPHLLPALPLQAAFHPCTSKTQPLITVTPALVFTGTMLTLVALALKSRMQPYAGYLLALVSAAAVAAAVVQTVAPIETEPVKELVYACLQIR